MNEKSVVAAFDFDGTITDRDMLIYFLFFTQGTFKVLYNFIFLIPSLVLYVFGRISRQETKERVMTSFFNGKTKEQMDEWGTHFAKEIIPRFVRKEALERIQWHQKRGDGCLIISATFDFFLKPWAKSVRIVDVISTSLEIEPQGTVSGKLLGKNCRGEEKVKRLKAFLKMERSAYILYAYGDSKGDLPLLAFADFAYYKKFPKE